MAGLALAAFLAAGPRWARGGVERRIEFNRDVRPILSENCFFCHGPDKNKRKAGLRLDLRDAAIEDGAIVPGRPDASEVVKRLSTRHPDDLMPPPETLKRVTPEQAATLRRWIAGGAEYQPHWSYVPVKRPPVPTVKNRSWVRNPIDAFILATLEGKALAPSRPADARTLARRASLDVVGLPPTMEEVRAFLADHSASAWERQVERLLASPGYGERMAVSWLDVVRYADTIGYHRDHNQRIFPYRDYVIESFNRNKPFDEFTVEQLAGDLLPHPGVEQLVATGFNRLNMVTREGGAQAKEYLAKYMADRVRAVGAAWLGATVGCAECHDHKYDPITAKDFYSLGAFFADVKEWGVYSGDGNNRELKGFDNEYPFPPEVMVDVPYLARHLAQAEAEGRRVARTIHARVSRGDGRMLARFRAFQAQSRRFLQTYEDGWAVNHRPALSGELATGATVEPDGVVVLRRRGQECKTGNTRQEARKKDAVRVELTGLQGPVAALRLEVVPHAGHGGSGLCGTGDFGEVRLAAELADTEAKGARSLAIHAADAIAKQTTYKDGQEDFDIARVWRLGSDQAKQRQASVWELAEPVNLGTGDRLVVTLKSSALAAFRLSTSPFASLAAVAAPSPLAGEPAGTGEITRAAWLKRALRANGGRDAGGLAELFVSSTDAAPEQRQRLQMLRRKIGDLRGGQAPTLVTVSVPPRTIRVLPRGNWQDETGEIVTPDVPHFLPAIARPEGTRLTRLDLARWLVSRENPLTARTFVNRLWRQFFGSGLSSSLGDLGAQGEPPVHPELLDWLAAELMESGWDVKHMVRLILTSSAYRQDSTVQPELSRIDPQNRLYARQSQRRLDAEFVRDVALSTAGLLDRELGGPAVFPYHPDGYDDILEFLERDYIVNPLESQYRRGVYVHWQRTFLHPMLANFDAPSREECVPERPPSNTPQQALTLLNDPSFLEAARVFAERLLRRGRGLDDETRIARAFEMALARAPRPEEHRRLGALLGVERERFGTHPGEAAKLLAHGLRPPARDLDAVEHAAWTSVCRVIFNLYEFITRV